MYVGFVYIDEHYGDLIQNDLIVILPIVLTIPMLLQISAQYRNILSKPQL